MSYLMAGQLSELDRLQLQSRVWEPAGERLLAELGDGSGKRVLDVGCGCLGWLRLLSRWVGPDGSCVGTDVDETLLKAAATLVEDERLRNVGVVRDDLFDSALPEASFDLVHARFQLAPIGRMDEQLVAYTRLLRPGGLLVLEDPDSASWRFQPESPACAELIRLIVAAFHEGGGDFDAGRVEFGMLTAAGLQPLVRAEIVALPPGHPYLRLPLQFATSLRPRLLGIVGVQELDRLLGDAEAELTDPARWGTTFTVVQTWAVVG
jgi:SAM-dependent methyltransferase